MNVSNIITRIYKSFIPLAGQKNKPNSNPIKANFKRAKMNINSFTTKDYRKKDDFAVRKNKPNSNPISEKPKMNVNLYDIEDYENKPPLGPKKTNPNKANFRRNVRMNINFCAAGYYHRVVLFPLNEHIDIIYQRFFASDVVIILNL